MRIGRKPVPLEVSTGIDGVTFAECWPRRVVLDLDGVAVNANGRHDLKRNKAANRRAKGLADLEQLD